LADTADDRRASASVMDVDGVRVVARSTRRRPAAFAALAIVGMAVGGTSWLLREPPPRQPTARPVTSLPTSTPPAWVKPAPASTWTVAAPPAVAGQASPSTAPSTTTTEWTSGDPNDLASWFKPGDPAPTMGEVIETLHEMGIRTGLGAFSPPGTSPPLVGLAVPPDFPLPPGYVRHHQVTDDGVPLEAVLMFAPEAVLRDATGRVIPLPEDLLVPPELAPPGLPIRRIEVPTP
jgi:hypothetical protein